MIDRSKYNTRVIRVTIWGYPYNQTNALANAIADADPENANIEIKHLRAGRVECKPAMEMTDAANGLVETTEIQAIFANDPLRVARVFAALAGMAEHIKSVDINSGRTVGW
jgi:hypothetical protein